MEDLEAMAKANTTPPEQTVSECAVAGFREGLTGTPLSEELLRWPPDGVADWPDAVGYAGCE